ncbi:MAG: chalcone isomerase family protein [Psychromonas sp.]|nr:chalcone isomerase family protein [Psychromonas sp.]
MQKSTVVKARLRICILLLAFFIFPVFADSMHNLKNVGQGKMSWLFMDIYQASLFSKDGRYQPKQYPQALIIRYQRNFSKSTLLKATQQQWQKLSVDENLYQQWLQTLSVIWPEIKKGERLTFLVSSNGRGDFYHNGNWLGSIDNPDFSDAFLSIWLSENTSEPDLRRKLIGETK